jgi:hypothetical protein
LKYDNARRFSEGLAAVRSNGKWRFINRIRGKEIIPLKYDFADDFSYGHARVKLNNKEFTINVTGQCVEDCPD